MRRWRRGELVWSGGKCFPWQSLPGRTGGTQYQSPLSAEGEGGGYNFQSQILKKGESEKNECLVRLMSSCHGYLPGGDFQCFLLKKT